TEQLELAASIYRQAREGIMVLSDKGIIVDVNEAFTRITGYTKEEAIGKPPTLLNSGDQSDEFYREVWSNMQQQGYWSGEVWNRRKNGERYPELLSVSRVSTGQHSTHFVALSSDITEIKEYEEQLRHIAHFDVLTGLPNRALLFDRLGMALEQTKREQKGLAVFFIDLDGFKEVNDTHGHDAGDFLLTELSRRLSSVLRSGDTLARLGGDEFVAVLPGVQGKDQLTPILMRMLQEMNRPVIMSGDIELTVTASIGISLFSGDGDSGVNQLVTEADQAMYQAKLKGKNSFCFAPRTDKV
ncbi:MAG: diguanylate cyclase, partial [Oceanospirillum sp.]|nr:diguanylate cyclase [Oceanospirillum sp.]